MGPRFVFGVVLSHLLLLAAFLWGPLVLAPLVLVSAAGWWWARQGKGRMVSLLLTVAVEAIGVAFQTPLWPLLGATVVLLPLATAWSQAPRLPLILAGGAGFGLAALCPVFRLDLPFGVTLLVAGIVVVALDQFGNILRKEGRSGHL